MGRKVLAIIFNCVQCGKAREAGHRFCSHCGALLDAQRELKQVTVLLADLCDSTAQVVASDLEDGQAYLESAYKIMADAVTQCNGTRVQWRGDELLALFGAPLAQEDHAVNACRAALRILEQMSAQTTAALPMTVRIGIDSGEVIVGPGGGDLAARYSADGPPIHLASRLERLALPGTAVISASTRRLAEYRIDTLPLGTRAVRSFKEPIEIFQIVAECQLSPAASLARRRHLGPMVGREVVLDELEGTAQRLGRTGMRAIGIRGDAGIGKSRLIDELCIRLQTEGVTLAAVKAGNYAGDIPFGLATDLVRALIDQGTATRGSEPAFIHLLGSGDPGEVWRTLTPEQRRHQIIKTVVELVTELTRAGPLILVIDDVFLADADSLRLLESLGRHVAGRPLLLLMTYRSEFVHRWGDAPWFLERVLEPLSTARMAELSEALLGNDASLSEVQQALLDRADGNPFFFEQMALMLVDQGSLVGQPGSYGLVSNKAQMGVPASVMAAIAARVDRLTPAAKLGLEAGAVTGEPLNATLIAQMLMLEPALVSSHLREAASSGLLGEAASGAGDHVFRHALVRETIYKGLTRGRRSHLHRSAFDALRTPAAEASTDSAPVLATHAYLGGDWTQAAEFSRRAMSRSTALSANRDALRVFERGLDAAGKIVNEPERLAQELGLRMEALGPLMAMGHLDGIVANLERAEAITRSLGETRRHAAVSLQLAVSLWTRGNYRQGLDAANNAYDAALQADSRSLQMAAVQARMMLEHGMGRYADASDDAARIQKEFAAELAARRLLPGWAVVAVVNLKAFQADLLANEGRVLEAQAALDAAYNELAAPDHAFSRVLVDFVQAGLMIMLGEAVEATALMQSAKERCQTQDVATMLPPILARLTGALALSGHVEQALGLIEPAIEQKAFLIGGRYNDYYFPYYHAIALCEAGRLDDAARAAKEAVESAMALEQNAHAAYAHFLSARIASRAREFGEARVHLDGARALAMQCHMPWLLQQVTAETNHAGAAHGN
jgi:class 3 adenylate cyclase/tetratricopeptide (TPR) repeat protein